MQSNHFNRGIETGINGRDTRKSLEELAAELDELAMAPTEVLADWVTARGRCLWESTFGELPGWTGEEEADGELAYRLCAGCPVRAECLEFESRVSRDQAPTAWGALNGEDRRVLQEMWRARRREQLAELSADDEEAGQ